MSACMIANEYSYKKALNEALSVSAESVEFIITQDVKVNVLNLPWKTKVKETDMFYAEYNLNGVWHRYEPYYYSNSRVYPDVKEIRIRKVSGVAIAETPPRSWNATGIFNNINTSNKLDKYCYSCGAPITHYGKCDYCGTVI